MKILLLSLLGFLGLPALSQNVVRLSSPSGKIVVSLRLTGSQIRYDINFGKSRLIENAELGLRFSDADFEKNLAWKAPVFRDTTEDYSLVVGKTSIVHAHYREITLPVQEINSPFRRINLCFRAFDDGLAFRYQVPVQGNWRNSELLEEHTSFNLSGDPMVRALFLPDYTTSHEGPYGYLAFHQVREDTLWDMPALLEYPGKIYMAITEAALLDYPGMYLARKGNRLLSQLSPLPGKGGVKARLAFPHVSPWRVFLISDRIGDLLESNMLTTLSPACALEDVSWLRPGKTTFPWWNGNVLPDSINAPGNNFVTAKYYIDFCARNHIQYHSVVEYGLHQWYVDDGVGFQPGPHADVTRPVPGLDMKEICDYARPLGVDIRVWVHWKALYPKLDSAFAIFEQWGLKGMMVDFMDRDDQEMVNIQTEILQKAARHHLHIQFHGAYKPTGLSRTYPNEFTREGTRNYEVDKWDDHGLSPDHDINIPFTRMLAGSTDYHLGGFRAANPAQYKQQYTRPLVLGTRCHMLAMYVVLENYLQMVCDYPAAYEGEDGFEFIRAIPTTWDQIFVPDAVPGEFISIARRKGQEWYLGAISNHQDRIIQVPLQFLGTGKYLAEIYSDADDAFANPNHLNRESREVTGTDRISLKLASGGGAVIHFYRVRN
jgi:alpha-glucosidase